MYKKVTIMLAMALAAWCCRAQVPGGTPQGSDTSRWDFHMGVGGAVLNGFGQTQALTWAAPSVAYHANRRLTLHGGFVAAGTLLPNDFQLHGRYGQSLAPRREGTRAGALWAAADWQASDNLRVWAAVAVARGWMQPLWADESMPLAAVAVDGGFTYRFSGGSTLGMHFTFVHDSYGSLLYPPYCGYPYCYSPLAPSWTIHESRLWNPFAPF